MEILTKGTKVYNHGDQCNPEGFFTITKVVRDTYGTRYEVEEYDTYPGDEPRKQTLMHCGFSEEFKGHGGTRLVTVEAYEAYRAANIFESQEAMRFVGRG